MATRLRDRARGFFVLLLAASAVTIGEAADPFVERVLRGTHVESSGSRVDLPARSSRVLRSLPPWISRGRDARGAYIDVRARVSPGSSDVYRELVGAGVEVRARLGDQYSLRVPLSVLGSLVARSDVKWVKTASPYHLMADISTGPDHVASREANAVFGEGSGVIVAVIDTGIDWTNLDFRHEDGTTRILGIWDQTLEDPLHGPPSGFTFGSFYSAATLDDALAEGGGLATEDVHGHGTHVAGIAVGNGRQTGNGSSPATYAGVAPRADLLVIKIFEGSRAEWCDACDLTAAIQFVRDFATAAGKPWVANLSLGGDLGAHDGSSPDELAIDSAVGPGIAGAQVAIAAGNSGSVTRKYHWSGRVTQGQTSSNLFEISDLDAEEGSDNDFVWLDLWYGGIHSVTVTVTTPGGEVVAASRGNDSGIVCTPSGAVQIDAGNSPDSANGDNQTFVQIWDSGMCDPVVEPASGVWAVAIHVDSAGATGDTFDLWNAADTRGVLWVDFETASNQRTLTVPGTSRNGLTTASYVSRDQWPNVDGGTTGPCCGTTNPGTVSYFSGNGPTRDGRGKPDIAGPGEFIASSISSSDATPPSNTFTAYDGEHHYLRGTSMATPHVAGAAALLLGDRPEMDGAMIRTAIHRAARVDAQTGEVPNPAFGAGKLRALEASYEAAAMDLPLTAEGQGQFGGDAHAELASYNVYRGTIPGLSGSSYGTCFLAGLGTPEFSDLEPPVPGSAFFYLVVGVYEDPLTSSFLEGALGTDSAGNVRPNTSSCP